MEQSWFSAICELSKARLSGLVLLTTLAGFYLGSSSPASFGLMFHALGGTALLAIGAAALNQLLERDLDARMNRTENRPLPSGRIQPDTALFLEEFARPPASSGSPCKSIYSPACSAPRRSPPIFLSTRR